MFDHLPSSHRLKKSGLKKTPFYQNYTGGSTQPLHLLFTHNADQFPGPRLLPRQLCHRRKDWSYFRCDWLRGNNCKYNCWHCKGDRQRSQEEWKGTRIQMIKNKKVYFSAFDFIVIKEESLFSLSPSIVTSIFYHKRKQRVADLLQHPPSLQVQLAV